MIHRDFCNPEKTKYLSPGQIQFFFFISRHVCWDGRISYSHKELAVLLNFDIQTIKKYVKKGVKSGDLLVDGGTIYLLKRVEDPKKGYIKHYPFLESDEFKKLSPHAQRLCLYFLWAGVHSGLPMKRALSAFYHTNEERKGVLNLYHRALVYPILEEVKTFFKLTRKVDLEGNEEVCVAGLQNEYVQEKALENQGEVVLLNKILKDHYYDEFLSNTSMIEILKIKKHYFTTFGSVGIDLFTNAIKTLFSIHKVYELNQRGEIGAYLKRILIDYEGKIIPVLKEKLVFIKNAVNTTISLYDFFIEGTKKNLDRFTKKMEIYANALQTLLKKEEQRNQRYSREIDTHSYELGSFPFYNWLEDKPL
jgi:hypothetical protein